jgi:hypothetical protein
METELKPDYFYSVKEIAFLWNVDDETVRRIFLREPGTMVHRDQKPGKRIYRLIRIPGHVALRVLRRMTVVEAVGRI